MNIIDHLKELVQHAEVFAEDEVAKLREWLSREETAAQAAIAKLTQHGYTVTPPGQ